MVPVTFAVEADNPTDASRIADMAIADIKADYGHYIHPVRNFAAVGVPAPVKKSKKKAKKA